MAKKSTTSKSQGITPAGKVAILLAVFGVPVLFFLSSYGLSRLFEIAPVTVVGVLVLVATGYTAYTSQLMYQFYEVQPPIMRFVPCLCETTLIDLKYHLPCYILYALAIIFAVCSQLPYSVLKVLGDGIALNAGFYFTVVAILMLSVIQIIKGIGLMSTMKDISDEWQKQVHADVGALNKLIPLGFLPFVRVIALYSLNKPLSTMVSFMEVTVSDASDDDSFEEEEE